MKDIVGSVMQLYVIDVTSNYYEYLQHSHCVS